MKVKNLVSTDASDGVFTTISGSLNTRLLFVVSLYRSLVQNMDDAGLRYIHSQVRQEFCINKDRYQDWFFHRIGAKIRDVFRLSIIQVTPVPFNCIRLSQMGISLLNSMEVDVYFFR